MDETAWQLLCCPATHQPLRRMSVAELESLKQRIQSGKVQSVSGDTVMPPIDGALVREDEKIAYPIRNEIPLLLVEAGLNLEPDE
jgi:uncharacterized protein